MDFHLNAESLNKKLQQGQMDILIWYWSMKKVCRNHISWLPIPWWCKITTVLGNYQQWDQKSHLNFFRWPQCQSWSFLRWLMKV